MIAVRCILGFLLQMLPCAVLCLVPFARRFAVPARRAYALAGGVLLAFCVAFVVVGTAPLDAQAHAYRAFAENIVFMAALVALCIVYVRVVRAETPQKVFVLLVVASYGCLVMYLVDTSKGLLGITYAHDGYMYELPTLAMLAAVTAVSFPFVLLLMRSLGRLIDRLADGGLWRMMCFPPAGLLAVALLGNWMPLNMNVSYQMTNSLLCVALIVLGLVFAWWLTRLLSRADRAAAERVRLVAEAQGYRRLAQNADELRRMRHDMNHQLQAINAYLNSGNVEGARRYVGEAVQEAAALPSVVYCRNPLANAILAEYAARAQAAGATLECEAHVPEDVGVSDVHLCRLLSNMLDNAVEGCRAARAGGTAPAADGTRSPSAWRAPANAAVDALVIRFAMRQEDGFLFVSCDNPCDEAALRRRGVRFASTKRDAARGEHGLGLGIMAEIAETYDGSFECDASGGRFRVFANLCIWKENDSCTA